MTQGNETATPEVAKPSARSKAGWFVAGAVAAIAALIAIVVSSRDGEARSDLPPSDVPKIEGNAIVFTDGFRKRAGLDFSAAKEAPLKPVVRVGGTVTFDPEHVAAVGTRVRGLVRRIFVYEGARVQEGDVLAEIESAELGTAQSSLAMLRAELKAAERNAEREKSLVAKNLSTAREAEVAEANRQKYKSLLIAAQQEVALLSGGARSKSLGVYQLRAPMSGTVVERHIAADQSVEAHLVAFRVANLDHLWIELDVYENAVSRIRNDDLVELHPLADFEHSIEGRVAHIGQLIDEATRSAKVRVEVDNKKRMLRPGQAVTARIHSSGGSASQHVVVPVGSITHIDGRPTLFVEEQPNRVVSRPVTLGGNDGEAQVVLEGVKPGESVVSSGVFALKSEIFR